MMQDLNQYKKKIGFAGLCLLVLHFAISFVYVMPEQFVPHKAHQLSKYYMLPAFQQNWNLFAPNPPNENKRLLFRSSEDGHNWSNWIDPKKDLLQKHYKYRVSYHGPLSLSVSNFAYFLHKNYAPYAVYLDDEELVTVMSKNGAYLETKKFANRYLDWSFSEINHRYIQIGLSYWSAVEKADTTFAKFEVYERY